jgi:hypothetical protein
VGIDADKRGPYILQSEVRKAIKDMRDKKATGDDVLGDVLKLLGNDGFRIVTQVINNMNDTGERPKDFTVIAPKKESKARICSDHCKIQPYFTYSKGA